MRTVARVRTAYVLILLFKASIWLLAAAYLYGVAMLTRRLTTDLGMLLIMIIPPLLYPLIPAARYLRLFYEPVGKYPDLPLLKRSEYPGLYQQVDEICKALKCPRFSKIYLTVSCSACIINKKHCFGHSRLLVLGLPLFLILDETEMTALLSHECAHYGRALIMKQSLLSLESHLNERIQNLKPDDTRRHSGRYLLIKRILLWLGNLRFECTKELELAADTAAVNIAGAQPLIDLLTKIEFYHALVNPAINQTLDILCQNEAEPITEYFDFLQGLLRGKLKFDDGVFGQFVASMQDIRAFPFHTHPTVAERARNTGAVIPDSLRQAQLVCAFREGYSGIWDSLLGKGAPAARDMLNKHWVTLFTEQWEHTHQACVERAQEIQWLESLETPDYGQKLRLAELVQRENPDRSLELLREAQAMTPDNVIARYREAEQLALRLNAEGPEKLLRLAEEDSSIIPYAYKTASDYCLRTGDRQKAVELYWQAVSFIMTNEQVKAEREFVPWFNVKMDCHDLSYMTLDRIRQRLAGLGAARAYIVCPRLKHSCGFMLYYVGLRFKDRISKQEKNALIQRVQEELKSIDLLPWEFRIIDFSGQNIHFEYAMSMIPGSRIL